MSISLTLILNIASLIAIFTILFTAGMVYQKFASLMERMEVAEIKDKAQDATIAHISELQVRLAEIVNGIEKRLTSVEHKVWSQS